MRGKILILLVSSALGIAIGAGVMWVVKPNSDHAVPKILEGYVSVANWDGTAIGFRDVGSRVTSSYVIAGAMWRNAGQPWHEPFPTCIQPLTSGQKVRLGIIHVEPTENTLGGP